MSSFSEPLATSADNSTGLGTASSLTEEAECQEVLRLKHVQGLPERAIARTLGVSNGVVHGYLTRARAAGLSWPLPEGMTDEGLELLLFPAPRPASQSPQRPVPDWSYVDKELRRRNVTRRLLWEEYRAANPDGFGYT